jgi:hypothetical protein
MKLVLLELCQNTAKCIHECIVIFGDCVSKFHSKLRELPL